ncbi:MAG: decarboxylating 6-phosphogluconate dehydrogenase [Desulfarculaceae bacterium]|nr:decarboxylating 6-phosphogluconate dehydrogenase [Desulfarculaceae bacterium]MCF8048301.1 decarboxylating 6-phosphogluconate dehydrogenase [Desulfarculaceae bacterium]MCF8064621.1 decarboxylating 6-phosphogluconate dehydrogenase [Desulfarculaceae bacterium]MCF8096639.1 decarboxylating 6-phosphogluconate dehydrogenase [Desulfarculaceae bacterium]MCF8123678.1 decarboxylating 6-phosphogluconate dehydrogenase [Desulfarculaceae bacterium]
MQIAMVGLGRMGMNMAKRLARGGHEVVAYNRTAQKAHALAAQEPGVAPVESLDELREALAAPRVVWFMLPAEAVDAHLDELAEILEPGDLVVEGGNSLYKDDLRRASLMQAKGIAYLDAGVSGGVWGLSEGYCIMAGGAPEDFTRLEPALATLCQPGGFLHTGPVGSGHFVKMIHNGIEYGMMQAYAEGFELMKQGPFSEHHDFAAICGLWQNGSVVRSWLLELLQGAFDEQPGLEGIAGYVEDSGEGRWSVQQAVESAVSAPVITMALMERFRSRREDTFGDKVLAALRNQFGGHAVKKSE